MILETLSDFFLFLSTDKKEITVKNLIDFDTLTNRKPFEEIYSNLQSLLMELIYFSSKHFNIAMDPNIEGNINLKAQKIFNEKYKNEKADSYVLQYKKPIEIKKIKDKEIKIHYLSLLRSNKLSFSIDPILFISFFNKGSSKYRHTVNKFMARIKPLIEQKAKGSAEGNNNTADDLSHSDLDKSNVNNKSGLSSISDKEGLLQNKDKFLDVLNKVKLSLIKEVPEENAGKQKNTIDSNDIHIDLQDNNNNNPAVNKGISKEGGRDGGKNDIKSPKVNGNLEKNNTNDTNISSDSHRKKNKKKKETTTCNCIIY